MLSSCGGQLRLAAMGPAGLDYGAVIQLAELYGVTADPFASDLLAESLAIIERDILISLKSED